jgi:hypothetical protein
MSVPCRARGVPSPDLISHPKGNPEDEVRNNDGTNTPKIKISGGNPELPAPENHHPVPGFPHTPFLPLQDQDQRAAITIGASMWPGRSATVLPGRSAIIRLWPPVPSPRAAPLRAHGSHCHQRVPRQVRARPRPGRDARHPPAPHRGRRGPDH